MLVEGEGRMWGWGVHTTRPVQPTRAVDIEGSAIEGWVLCNQNLAVVVGLSHHSVLFLGR